MLSTLYSTANRPVLARESETKSETFPARPPISLVEFKVRVPVFFFFSILWLALSLSSYPPLTPARRLHEELHGSPALSSRSERSPPVWAHQNICLKARCAHSPGQNACFPAFLQLCAARAAWNRYLFVLSFHAGIAWTPGIVSRLVV